MALVGINTVEDNKYESFYIVMSGLNHDKVFDSGDPIKDWYNCTKHFIQYFEETEDLKLEMTNDVISFLLQNHDYDIMNLTYDSKEINISYNTPKEGAHIGKIGWLFLIKKNERPTFEELKKQIN